MFAQINRTITGAVANNNSGIQPYEINSNSIAMITEEENEARNKKIEEIIRKFKASEYDALKAEIAQNEYSGEDGYYSEDDIEIKGDKLVLDILENEKLTKEEADLLKDFMKDQVSKIKNMPDFVTRIENACK